MNKLALFSLLLLPACGFNSAEDFWNHRIEGAPGNGDAVCVMWTGIAAVPFPCGKPREDNKEEK